MDNIHSRPQILQIWGFFRIIFFHNQTGTVCVLLELNHGHTAIISERVHSYQYFYKNVNFDRLDGLCIISDTCTMYFTLLQRASVFSCGSINILLCLLLSRRPTGRYRHTMSFKLTFLFLFSIFQSYFKKLYNILES